MKHFIYGGIGVMLCALPLMGSAQVTTDSAMQLAYHKPYIAPRKSGESMSEYSQRYYRTLYGRNYTQNPEYRKIYNRYYGKRDSSRSSRSVSVSRDGIHYYQDRGGDPDTVSGMPSQHSTNGQRVFVFSPRLKMWAAYNEDGQQVAGGRANGGSHYCSDLGHPCRTPGGVFRVHSKGTANCVSRKFPVGRGGAPMPYCMYFLGGYAIHGSPYISDHNGSHGCIRVQTSAARWLHQNFMRQGTKVVVLSY